MQAGIVIGEVARIDGLIQAVWDELGYETRVVATGDDAQAMAGLSRRIEIADDRLTLNGLIMLYEKNRKPRSGIPRIAFAQCGTKRLVSVTSLCQPGVCRAIFAIRISLM